MTLPLRTKLLYATSNVGSEALVRSRTLWLLSGYFVFRADNMPDDVRDRIAPQAAAG